VPQHFDALVIGAGMSGMYQLIKLRELGLSVRVLEAGTGVGGTWYWNRYPGARFDSETYSYQFSFDKDLLESWDWQEHFAPQPETLRYLNHVADKYDLRRDIQFRSRVKSAHYQEASNTWLVTLEDGSQYSSRFLITAVGPLSAPTMPNIPGIKDFKGTSYHTANWPHEPVQFEGKRVAVIGTGATGVQTIQEVAKTAKSLTVFQRTPNWCAPLLNRKITPEEMQEIRAGYPALFQLCMETFSCFIHTPIQHNTFDLSKQEREAVWEELYNSPGFGIWLGNFKDIMTNREANAELSAFVANKIRQRVEDPVTAEKLIPKNHGFGTRRVPMETKYYEVYNLDNVKLVDIRETPIASINETGIKTSDAQYDFDIIIFATGFDAITGSFDRIDFRGVDGQALRDRWRYGPETYLGMTTNNFPNMMMLVGPHMALGNIPRTIEFNVEWVTDLVKFAVDNKIERVEPSAADVQKWTDHVKSLGEGNLAFEVDSWMTGVNSNVEGKQVRIINRYSGSAPEWRRLCNEEAERGYPQLCRRVAVAA